MEQAEKGKEEEIELFFGATIIILFFAHLCCENKEGGTTSLVKKTIKAL